MITNNLTLVLQGLSNSVLWDGRWRSRSSKVLLLGGGFLFIAVPTPLDP